MKILESVYKTEKLKYKAADIKQQIRRKEDVGSLHLILLNQRDKSRIEMIKCSQLYQEFYPVDRFVILGIAENKKTAEELLTEMIEEAVRESGSADPAAFFSELLEDTPLGEIRWH